MSLAMVGRSSGSAYRVPSPRSMATQVISTGNYPCMCQIEVCGCEGYPSPIDLNESAASWVEVVPRSPLRRR